MNKSVLIPVLILSLTIGLFSAIPAEALKATSETTDPIICNPTDLTEQYRINKELFETGFVFDPEYRFVHLDYYNAVYGNNVDSTDKYKFGGFATVVVKDACGDIISKQTVHNRVVDQGEDWMIDELFKEGTAGESADADQLATICLSAEVGFTDTSETETAALFDTDDGLAGNNCISDASVSVASQIATIGALTFDAPTHVPNDTVVTGIGICQGAAATPFNQCQDAQAASAGILWSQINIADVTLPNLATVDITYNLDVSSAGS